MFDFPSAEMTLICPSCSAMNYPDAPQCRSCGTVFEGATRDPGAVAPTEIPPEFPSPSPTPPPQVPPTEAVPHSPVGPAPPPPSAAPIPSAAPAATPPPQAPSTETVPPSPVSPAPTGHSGPATDWSAAADAFFGTAEPPAARIESDVDDTQVHASVPPVEPAPDLPAADETAGPPVGELVGPYGRTQALSGVMTLGRDPRNSIVLNDASVSRVHCRIDTRTGRVLVADLKSTNGTWVNGHGIEHAELADGDRLLVGRTELVFRDFTRPPT